MFSLGALEISAWSSNRELTFVIFWQCVEIEIGLTELRWTIRLADRSIFSSEILEISAFEYVQERIYFELNFRFNCSLRVIVIRLTRLNRLVFKFATFTTQVVVLVRRPFIVDIPCHSIDSCSPLTVSVPSFMRRVPAIASGPVRAFSLLPVRVGRMAEFASMLWVVAVAGVHVAAALPGL